MKGAAAKEAGPHAEQHAREAAAIIHTIAEGLSPERAATYLAAAPVVDALALVR